MEQYIIRKPIASTIHVQEPLVYDANEIKKDWMLSLPCAICGEVLLLRKDNPVCTRCRRS